MKRLAGVLAAVLCTGTSAWATDIIEVAKPIVGGSGAPYHSFIIWSNDGVNYSVFRGGCSCRDDPNYSGSSGTLGTVGSGTVMASIARWELGHPDYPVGGLGANSGWKYTVLSSGVVGDPTPYLQALANTITALQYPYHLLTNNSNTVNGLALNTMLYYMPGFRVDALPVAPFQMPGYGLTITQFVGLTGIGAGNTFDGFNVTVAPTPVPLPPQPPFVDAPTPPAYSVYFYRDAGGNLHSVTNPSEGVLRGLQALFGPGLAGPALVPAPLPTTIPSGATFSFLSPPPGGFVEFLPGGTVTVGPLGPGPEFDLFIDTGVGGTSVHYPGGFFAPTAIPVITNPEPATVLLMLTGLLLLFWRVRSRTTMTTR